MQIVNGKRISKVLNADLKFVPVNFVPFLNFGNGVGRELVIT